jgi:hypothetical protein
LRSFTSSAPSGSLLLAARELARAPALQPLELDDPEDLLDPPLVLSPRDVLHLEPERDVVVDRHVREEGVLLEDHVHGPAVRGHRRDVVSLQHDPALVRPLEARDHAQGRRLAAPARPEQREELALGDLERDVVDRRVRAEALADADEADRRAPFLLHLRRV